MPKFPEPPDLQAIDPAWHELPAGTLLWRLYSRGGAFPTTWRDFRFYGPVPTSRFDHQIEPPHVQSRGILYLASAGPTCFAEAFQRTRTIERWRNDPWLVGFETARPLRLLDLCNNRPTRAGASMVISVGPRLRAQRWTRAIYQAYPRAQGLWYPSSMDANRPCVALYERGADVLGATPLVDLPLAEPRLAPLIEQVAAQFGYRLAPRR